MLRKHLDNGLWGLMFILSLVGAYVCIGSVNTTDRVYAYVAFCLVAIASFLFFVGLHTIKPDTFQRNHHGFCLLGAPAENDEHEQVQAVLDDGFQGHVDSDGRPPIELASVH